MRLKGRSTPRLDKKLAGYTLIGAAAFTVTGVARADDVTYIPNVNVHVDGMDATPSYTINLGPTSITLSASAAPIDPGSVPPSANIFIGGEDSVTPGTGAFILTDPNGAAALGGGVTINATDPNFGAGGLMTNTFVKVPGPKIVSAGDWSASGGSAYLGFYFHDTDGTHTGWANVSTSSNLVDAAFTLNSYAYENTPDTPITTPAPVPEPSTLSLLAMGGAGLLEVRRRRQNHA